MRGKSTALKNAPFLAKRSARCLFGYRRATLLHFLHLIDEGAKVDFKSVRNFQRIYRLCALGLVMLPFLVPVMPDALQWFLMAGGVFGWINGVCSEYSVSELKKPGSEQGSHSSGEWQIISHWAAEIPSFEEFLVANGICSISSEFELDLIRMWAKRYLHDQSMAAQESGLGLLS